MLNTAPAAECGFLGLIYIIDNKGDRPKNTLNQYICNIYIILMHVLRFSVSAVGATGTGRFGGARKGGAAALTASLLTAAAEVVTVYPLIRIFKG